MCLEAAPRRLQSMDPVAPIASRTTPAIRSAMPAPSRLRGPQTSSHAARHRSVSPLTIATSRPASRWTDSGTHTRHGECGTDGEARRAELGWSGTPPRSTSGLGGDPESVAYDHFQQTSGAPSCRSSRPTQFPASSLVNPRPSCRRAGSDCQSSSAEEILSPPSATSRSVSAGPRLAFSGARAG